MSALESEAPVERDDSEVCDGEVFEGGGVRMGGRRVRVDGGRLEVAWDDAGDVSNLKPDALDAATDPSD